MYVGHVNINVYYRVTGGDPPLAPHDLVKQLPRQNVVPGGCSGVMVSKEVLQRAGAFDVRFQPLADWDLWLRLAQVDLPACVPKPLVAYRLHGAQMSLDASRVEAEFWRLAERNPEADPANLYRYLGWWALRVNNHRAALRYFVRARLHRRPTHLLPALLQIWPPSAEVSWSTDFGCAYPPPRARVGRRRSMALGGTRGKRGWIR